MKPSFAAVELPGLNKAQVQEDVKTLFGAEVSEEFLNKATSLYEASINTNLQTITEQMANIFEEKLAESVVQVAEELENKVLFHLEIGKLECQNCTKIDVFYYISYLNKIIEDLEFLQENK